MAPEETETIIINLEEADIRLDKILAERFAGRYSRTYFEKLIKDHLVSVNGQPVKKRTLLQEGDEVEIHFVLTPEIDVQPEAIPLEILYEDEDLIVVNKPPSMVVHPAVGNWSGTFVNALLYHCKKIAPEGDLRPGIVHRLDKDTSGVMIAAKNSLAQQKLIEQFARREVKKTYLAICLGNPGKRVIDAPIGRHPIKRKEMAVVENGRDAKSAVETLGFDGKLSYVRIEPYTGRTHQIRVHLRHLGTPVLGDSVYGNEAANKKFGAMRQLLHAEKLELKHPTTGKPLIFVAPLPPDIKAFADKI